jgi:hypothetical protein
MRFDPLPCAMPNMRLWLAATNGYSFCISEELEEGDPEWSGFKASWKNNSADMRPFGKRRANMIEGGPWKTRIEAERACEQTLRQLMAKQ